MQRSTSQQIPVDLAGFKAPPIVEDDRLAYQLDSLALSGKNSTLVTSYETSVGKSTVAANLAVMMAMRGRKTLLIEANFLTPRLAMSFKPKDFRGLKTLLNNSDSPTDYVEKTLVPNLELLLGGGLSDYAHVQLETPRFGEILQYLKTKYHSIIVDTACLKAKSPRVLASNVDNILATVRVDRLGYFNTKIADILEKDTPKIIGSAVVGKDGLDWRYEPVPEGS